MDGLTEGALSFSRSRNVKEQAIGLLLLCCAAISTVVTVGIVGVLLVETIGFFRSVSPVDFFTGTQWTPLFQDPEFGVLPLMAGSFLVAGPLAAFQPACSCRVSTSTSSTCAGSPARLLFS